MEKTVLLLAIVISLFFFIPVNLVHSISGDDNDRLSLVLMGDIAFNDGIADRMSSMGAQYPFEKIKPFIEEADLRFGNLETPISERGQSEEGKYSTFRAGIQAVESLESAGIDVLSLANNHCLDYGPDALNDTMMFLKEAGIGYSGIWYGGGPDNLSAQGALIVEAKGRRIGFLACTEDVRGHWSATGTRPGPIPMEKGLMEACVRNLEPLTDILIVSIHWRKWPQYTLAPEPSDRELCRALIDAGADIIMGHGPHTVHEIEGYKGGLILYSLGNIAMKNGNDTSDYSYIVKVFLEESEVVGFTLIPMKQRSYRYVPMGMPINRTIESGFNVTLDNVWNMYQTDIYEFIGGEEEPPGLVDKIRNSPLYLKAFLMAIPVVIMGAYLFLLLPMKKGKNGTYHKHI